MRFVGVESEQLEYSHEEKEKKKRLIEIRADPFDPEFYLEAQHDLDQMILHIKRSVFLLKERYMMFLLHLNEDFEDDLLQDAIELLH